MEPFHYVRPEDLTRAATAASEPGAHLIAGGTTMVDLMRLGVMRPKSIVDIAALGLVSIDAATDGGVKIGALARNSDVAYHPAIVERFAVLSEALLAGASPQLRNMATVGGNLLQRTRCPYFRDLSYPCNKREPGAGCAAIGGFTRSHAVLGTSEHCIATNPSDMNVALVALDAVVHIRGAAGEMRTVPIAEFHTLPNDRPDVESVLMPGDLITLVELPATALTRSHYVKVRDRMSYAFALASAAVAIQLEGKTIRNARIALGGLSTKPWRALEAESLLVGKSASHVTFVTAADAALAGAQPRGDNAFKIELGKRTIVRALTDLVGTA